MVAGIGAGNSDAEWVESGVRSGGVGISTNVDADFFFGPVSLVNVREPLGKADTLFADEWRHSDDPTAIGAVLIGPPVSAVDGSDGIEDWTCCTREPRVTARFFSAG